VAVHRESPRAARPFVGINCAALAASLLESELFGYEKGAFTGAASAKPGLLETADGGTVFLDEVGEMPLDVQAKLLRVLELRQVMRVGGTRPRAFDARFVSATNRDLAVEVERGAFRRDLYYRLAGLTLTVAPLRERASEIAELSRVFARRAAAALGAPAPDVSQAALLALERYAWPGNVRELRNVVERAVVINGARTIALEHLPPEVQGIATRATASRDALDARATIAPQPGSIPDDDARGPDPDERRRILDALESCAGNQTRAAELLGIPRRTFTRRLALYDLPRPRRR
jgi:DNA-binding NtrC family response regulator